jgi:hypothetical protein
MSRPPQHEQLQVSAAATRRNIIDFVGVPVGAPSPYTYDDAYVQSMYPPSPQCGYQAFQGAPMVNGMGVMMQQPMVPGQMVAGQMVPGQMVPGQMVPGQMVAGQMTPNQMPGAYSGMQGGVQTGAWTGAPYQYMQTPYPQSGFVAGQQAGFMGAPYQQGSADSLSSPNQSNVSEESLRSKINSKIESIMEMQKADMLSNQIERLTDKVHKLSRNISMNAGSKGESTGSTPISSAPSDREEELNTRLKRLAAESSRKASMAARRNTYD